LSGFILAKTYESRLGRLPFAAAYGMFLRRRIVRLWPLYALTTIVCFLLVRAGLLVFLRPDASWAALGANLLAVQSWIWPGSSLNGPGWSISTEWLANLLFPLLVPLVLWGNWWRALGIAAVAIAAMVGSAVWFGQLFDVPSPWAVNVITGPGAVGRCLGEFALGMVCWRIRDRAEWAPVLGQDRVLAPLLVGLVVLMQWTVLDVPFVLGGAVLLTGLAFEASRVSRVLRSRVLMDLGRISYSIYLVHIALLPVRDMLAGWFTGFGAEQSWALAVICTTGLALGLAGLSWRFVEGVGQLDLVRHRGTLIAK
jgi:peptidoglycan/LPS O-acetylase OafA/YrhL